MIRKEKCRAKRLRGNKGSVLFFIVAIMSILVIIASAAYYAVNAAGKQVEVRYDSEQSYQSALALNDIITEYIEKNPSSGLISSVEALADGESIVTTGDDINGFSNLTVGLGDYKVILTKVKYDDVQQATVMKVTTEVVVNGETSAVTCIGYLTAGEVKPFGFDRFFTSTGYAPNDVYMSGMIIDSKVYLDNEFSQIGGGTSGSSGMNLLAEVISGGTLALNNTPVNNGHTNTFDITVGNNLYLLASSGQASIDLYGGKIRVGGNLVQDQAYKYKHNTDVYVVGDYICGSSSLDSDCEVYVNGDAVFFNSELYEGKVFVNGDLFLAESVNTQEKFKGGLQVGGKIYVCKNYGTFGNQIQSLKNAGINTDDTNKVVKYEGFYDLTVGDQDFNGYDRVRKNLDAILALTGNTSSYNYIWESVTLEDEREALDKVIHTINQKIGKSDYINWDLEGMFLDNAGNLKVTPTDFHFAEYVMTGPDSYNIDSNTYKDIIVVTPDTGNKIVVGDINLVHNQSYTKAIIFDTEKADGTFEDLYVYLKPNCRYDKTQKKPVKESDESKLDCFTWVPPTSFRDSPLHVFVKGKGSVVFVLPDNIRYYAKFQSSVQHIALYEACNSSLARNPDGSLKDRQSLTESSAVNNFKDKIYNLLDMNNLTFTDTAIQNSITNGTYLHNNIFMVTVDKNATMDFSTQQNFLGGFVYAPYMTLEYDGSGSQSGMLGGMVVSDYLMPSTSNSYIASVPYDYYNRFVPAIDESTATPQELAEYENSRKQYMTMLMESTGHTSSLNPSSSRSWRRYGYI